jgi:predicted RNA binding protein YcfA (HicA-like mRNA interferase family)
MRTPRNISSQDLIKSLKELGYEVTRQKGSHIRISTTVNGVHHETVPNHDPIKFGTIQSILKSIARHHGLTVQELIQKIGL